MSYFAGAFVRDGRRWTATDVDLDDVPDLDALADELRDLADEAEGPVVLLVDEDDEWCGVVRVDVEGLQAPRVFVSDARAVETSAVAALLWDGDVPEPDEDDDEDVGLADVLPVGDPALLDDLGVSAGTLAGLCQEEGSLPADVLAALAERLGCLDALEALRPA